MEVNASLINFAAGVLSKKFLGRTDLPNFYKAGLLVCRNYIPQVQGPADYRAGSKYVIHTRLNQKAAQYPFVFNDEQAYALSFTDDKLRFFSDGSIILEDATSSQDSILLHCNGANDGTSFPDATTRHTVNRVGTVTKTAVKKFGTASAYFDGSSYLEVAAASDDFDLGDTGVGNDYTIDFWMYKTVAAGSQMLMSTYSAGVNGWQISTAAGANINIYSGGANSAVAYAFAINTWYHVAIVRKDTTVTLYVDGVSQGTFTNFDMNNDGGKLNLGTGINGSSSNAYTGYLDEVRIVKGTAMFTANFAVPTAEYSVSGSKVITAVTAASPGVVTIAGHGYATGDEIYISGVLGMTELNGKFFLVTYINADTFSLTDIDGTAINTTAYTAYTSGGVSEKIYEIDTPYAEADLDTLQMAQKADLMYIVHPNYEPRKLIRSGEASWALSTFTRTDDPFAQVITGITQASPGVVTSATHGFEDGDTVEIWGVAGMTELNGNKYMVANKAANTFELTDPDTSADIDTSGYGAYTSAGVAFKEENMPGAVAFYAGRLFYGGTLDAPESFWGSKAPDNDGTVNYDVFTVGASAEDAVTFPISSQNNTADRIRWFSGVSKFLAIGTFGGVYKANGGSDATPISGTAIAVQAVDFVGSRALAPVRLGSSVFYVQRGGLILNRFSYSLLADDFRASSLNIFSDEITDSGIVRIAALQGTSDIIWAALDDGRLIGLTVKTDEEISAWHDHVLGGEDIKVLSVCGEPQPDNQDSLWIVAERTIDSLTRRYVEYFEAEDLLPEKEDTFTGVEATDDLTYRALLYEAGKHLVRVDSSLTLNTQQSIALTPGAVTGTGVTFTAASPLFTSADVGKYICKKIIDGDETGTAKITTYTSTTVVVCDIKEDFDVITQIAIDGWFLSAKTVTGLDHLEGETVAAQIDGADGGTYTVASGAITLGDWGTVIHVGLPYKGRLTTMPLDIGALVGTAQGKIMTVNRLGLMFRHTLGTKFGTDMYNLEQVQSRSVNSQFNRPPALVTDVEFLNLPDGYDRRKFIHILQDSPMPSTVQGIIPYVDTTNE